MSFGSDLQKALSDVNADALFKIDYKDYYDEVFNTSIPFWGLITKTNDFYGKRLEFPVPTGYQGGVGSGKLPESNVAPYGDVVILSKKMYATSRIDRESIMAALSDKGAFVRLISEAVKKTTEADVWNHDRAAFNDGTGSLGTIDSIVDNGGGNYDLVITAATWKEANWEEGMFINVHTGTDLFEIESVTASTRTIVAQRQAGGTDVPAGGNVVYMQGSRNNDIHGLKILDTAIGGTAYGVTVSRRWSAYNDLLSYGAAISPQFLNKLMLGVEKKCGKQPDTGVTSYTQFEKLVNQIEDKKFYSNVDVKPKGFKGEFGFKGVQFVGSQGVMNIFPDKFCEDDRFYAINSKYIKYYRRPNSGWVKEDIGGNGYLRVVDEDQFEARMATYGDLFVALPFHGVADGLTT